MDKPLAVIEIADSALKLLVGTTIDKEPVIIYALKRPLTHVLEKGDIIDQAALDAAIASLKCIRDSSAKIKLTVSEATLVLPPLGLDIYMNDKTTTIVSPTGIIEDVDVNNVINLIRRDATDKESVIIDIIPDYFLLSDGRRFREPPLGEKASTLTLAAKIHMLPRHVVEAYERPFKEAGIRIKRRIVAPYATVNLIAARPELPSTYILIDMGAAITTFTLVGKDLPYCSTFIPSGGRQLDEAIMRAFRISENEAEALKIRFGHEISKRRFTPPIITVKSADGTMSSYTLADLNVVTKAFLDEYLASFVRAIDVILNGYSEEVKTLPLILTGGFSELPGLFAELKRFFPNQEKIEFLDVMTLGAREPAFAPLLGALLAGSGYHGTLTDRRAKVAHVERLKDSARKK